MYQTTDRAKTSLLTEVQANVAKVRADRQLEVDTRDRERQEREATNLKALELALKATGEWAPFDEQSPSGVAIRHPSLIIDGIRFISQQNPPNVTALIPCQQKGGISFHKGDVTSNADRAYILGQLTRILDEHCTAHCSTRDENGDYR